MARSTRLRAIVQRLSTTSTFAPTRRPYLCYNCAAAFLRPSPSPAWFSTTPTLPDRPLESFEKLEWMGTGSWMTKYMVPVKPVKSFIPPGRRVTHRDHIRDQLLMTLVEIGLSSEAGIELNSDSPIRNDLLHKQMRFVTDGNNALHIEFRKAEQREEILQRLSNMDLEGSAVMEGQDLPEQAFADNDANGEEIGLDVEGISTREPSRIEAQALVGESETGSAREEDPAASQLLETTAASNQTKDLVQPSVKKIRATGDTIQIWRDVPLTDTEFKFKLIKRLTQRLRYRIPDPVVSKASTVGELHQQLLKRSKPTDMQSAIHTHKPFTGLSNVQYTDKKMALKARETQIGRWKIIKEELDARGLRK